MFHAIKKKTQNHKPMKFKIYLTFVILLFCSVTLIAQNYNYQSSFVTQFGVNGGESVGENIVTDTLGNYYLSGNMNGEGVISGSLLPQGGNFIAKFNSGHQILWIKTIDYTEEIYDIEVSKDGKVYLVGLADENTTLDTFSIPKGGFLIKLDTDGNVIWVDSIGGDKLSLTIDTQENLYLTGRGLLGGYISGVLIEKRSTQGVLVWTHTYGNSSLQLEFGIDIEIAGDTSLYVVGRLESLALNVGSGISLFKGASQCLFLVKINANSGNTSWGKVINDAFSFFSDIDIVADDIVLYVGGNNFYIDNNLTYYDRGLLKMNSNGDVIWHYHTPLSGIDGGISADKWGNVYLSSKGSCHTLCNYPYLTKVDSTGNFLWSKVQNPSIAGFSVNDCTVSLDGGIYVTGGVGVFHQIDFGFNDTIQNYQGYLLNFDSTGLPLTSYSFGGNSGNLEIVDIEKDTFDNIYVLGKTTATLVVNNDTISPNEQPIGLSTPSTFVQKFASNGNVIWSRKITSPYAPATQITSDFTGNVYISGSFRDSLVLHDGTIITTSSASTPFVAKYDSLGNVLWANSGQGLSVRRIEDMTIDASGGLYLVGDIYNSTSQSFDVYIEKFNSFNGASIVFETIQGNDDDIAKKVIATNNISNNVYILGEFKSATLGNFGNLVTNQASGSKDIFIIDITYMPNYSSGASIGSIGDDELIDAKLKDYYASGNNNEIIVLGRYSNPNLHFPGGLSFSNPTASIDYSKFIATFSNNPTFGSPIVSLLGGDEIQQISINKQNHIYLNIYGTAQIKIGNSWHPIGVANNNFSIKNKYLYNYMPYSFGDYNLIAQRNYHSFYSYPNNYGKNKNFFLKNGDFIWGTSLLYNFDSILINNKTIINLGGADYIVSRYYKNYFPDTLIVLSNSIYENQPIQTFIGNLTTTDQNSLDTFSYSLTNGTGDIHNSSFYISNDSLFTDTTFNYETQNTYSIRVQTDDGNGGTFEIPMTIHISDTNDVPTNLMAVDTIIPENQPLGEMVGLLSTTDEDIADNHIYSLITGTGDTDNGLFSISNDTLKAQTTFDFETQNTSYSIRVKTDDGNSGIYERVFTIIIQDINDIPDTFQLSNNIVAENQPIGTGVGILSTTDQDVSDIHTYSLVTGTGDIDNSKFSISGTGLETAIILDFEAQNSYSICLQTNDGNGGVLQQVFVITATDNNDIPILISSTDTTVTENQPTGTVVATLSTTDQDVSDVHTYSLVTGTGDTDNSKFNINGTDLETAIILDFEAQNSYSIRIKTDDNNGGILEQIFIISAIDSNDIPTLISSTDTSVTENQPIGTIVGTLSTTDQDVSDVHTYSLVTGTGDTDNSKFSINGTDLETAIILDFESQSSYSIRVKTDDNNGGTLEQIFIISAINANDNPSELNLSDTTLAENNDIGDFIGLLSSIDQDVNDIHTYSLITGTGDTDNSSFFINQDSLFTVVEFDFETQNSYSIRLQTNDGNGGVLEKNFSIEVIDIEPEPTSTFNQLNVQNIKLYPNPTTNILNVEVIFNTSVKEVKLELTDILGRKIWNSLQQSNIQELKYQFDVSDIPVGSYFLRIIADGKILTKKIIIQ
jgi:hypothetical protein